METTPSLSSRLRGQLQKHNPFYLLSAACMLFGCLAVTNSLSWMSIPTTRLLMLIGTLNLYEASLIALAWFLIKRRRLVVDGVTLLILEAFFLIDITFLSTEIATSHLTLGIWVNSFLFIASIAKLWFIYDITDQSPRNGRFPATVLQLAALFAMPTVFRAMDGGNLPPQLFYAAWWAIALIIWISLILPRPQPLTPQAGWARNTMAVFTLLPWLSLVAHLGNLQYVYGEAYRGAYAAPMLLALACLLKEVEPFRLMPRADLTFLRLLLPGAVILVSLNDPEVLSLKFGHFATITPSHLAITGAYLTYIYCFFQVYAVAFLTAGGMAALIYFFGPSAQTIGATSSKSWDWLVSVTDRLTPKTAFAWGVIAIGAAFAFLGLGAMTSLNRKQEPPPEPVAVPGPEVE